VPLIFALRRGVAANCGGIQQMPFDNLLRQRIDTPLPNIGRIAR